MSRNLLFSQWILAMWAGAVTCFMALLAPALFRVLTPEQAGSVVRQVLPVLDSMSLVLAPILLFLLWKFDHAPRRRGRFVAILLWALLAGVSQGVVTPKMNALREKAPEGISQLEKSHPLRREFGRWHGVSSSLMALELLLVLSAGVLTLSKKQEP